MANTTLKSRIVLCSKTSTQWAQSANASLVPLKGEICVETFTDAAPKIKIGDGTTTFANLPYATLTEAEIRSIVNQAAYNLQPATSSVLGGVMIGSNVDVASNGTISIKDASTSQKGVVQLNDAINSTSTTQAATANAAKKAYDRGSTGITNAATAQAAAEAAQQAADQAQDTADAKIGSVTLSGGTNNGTLKLTVDGTATDNIAVTGLGSAAYTATTAYATSAQGTKADNAMPKSGGTFTGAVTLNADPTANLGAATKQYVDTQITSKISASDAMVFKGTLGSGGTVTAVPTTGVVKGDTYKVITAGTWAGSACKVGDLLIALNSGAITANTDNWAYVPSGDEAITTIKYSTTTQNLTTSAQTGAITVGEAATKQVDTSISAASTSTKLPTSAAVASFVEGKGYVTTDNKVTNTLNTTTKAYVTGTTSATTNTGGQVFDTGVYLDTTAGTLHATKMTATTFEGGLTGKATSAGAADTAGKLASSVNVKATGKASGSTTTFDGSSELQVNITSFDSAGLTQTSGDYLILDGNFG